MEEKYGGKAGKSMVKKGVEEMMTDMMMSAFPIKMHFATIVK